MCKKVVSSTPDRVIVLFSSTVIWYKFAFDQQVKWLVQYIWRHCSSNNSIFCFARDSNRTPFNVGKSHVVYNGGIHNKFCRFCLPHEAVESVHAEWVQARALFAQLWSGCDDVFLPCIELSGYFFSAVNKHAILELLSKVIVIAKKKHVTKVCFQVCTIQKTDIFNL